MKEFDITKELVKDNPYLMVGKIHKDSESNEDVLKMCFLKEWVDYVEKYSNKQNYRNYTIDNLIKEYKEVYDKESGNNHKGECLFREKDPTGKWFVVC